MKNTFFVFLRHRKPNVFRAAIFFAVLFGNTNLWAQFNLYGTAAGSESFSRVLPLDGNYYAAGQSTVPPGHTAVAATLTKITANVNLDWVWSKQFVGPNGQFIEIGDVQASHGDNLIVVATVRPSFSSLENANLYVMEVSKNTGAILQAKIISHAGNNRFLNLKITKVDAGTSCPSCSGSYILAAIRDPVVGGAARVMVLVRLDYSLNITWANDYIFGGSTAHDPSGIVPTAGGGAIVAGTTNPSSLVHGFLMEVNCLGDVVASNGYKTAAGTVFAFQNLIRGFDGSLICNGVYRVGTGVLQGVVAKIRADYTPPPAAGTWSRVHSEPSENVIFTGLAQIQKTKGDIFTGYFTAVNGAIEPRLFKITDAGVMKSYRDLGGPYSTTNQPLFVSASATKVVVSSGRTVAAGGIGLQDAWLGNMTTAMTTCGTPVTHADPVLAIIKVSLSISKTTATYTTSNHCNVTALTYLKVDACSVSNKPAGRQTLDGGRRTVDRGFEMFPNPATETVEVVFSDEATAAGQTLQVFDFTGKLVKTQVVAEGTTESLLDIADLPSGIYLVKTGDGAGQKLVKE